MDLCKVCDLPASSFHFGVFSCRACAAFFRRSISSNKYSKLKCRGLCQIKKQMRKACRECRFQKCLASGMRDDLVIMTLVPEYNEGFILSSWKLGYDKLKQERTLHFKITEKTVSKASTYNIQNEVITVDSKLIIKNLLSEVAPFQNLCSKEQKTLLSQFLIPFHILECIFRATEPCKFLLPNGDFVDYYDFNNFYNSFSNDYHQFAVHLYKPYWDIQYKIIKESLDDTNLDSNEFIFVIALLFWDVDFHTCSEAFMMTCLDQKRSILKELCEYEKFKESVGRINEDRSLRTGKIVMILQAMQKTLSMAHESHEISQVYNMREFHDKFFDMLREI